MHTHTSLGTRPSKNRNEGLANQLGWKCTLRPVCRCTSDWFRDCKGCALITNANRTRAVFAFCFISEHCNTKRVRLEHLCGCLVLQKALLATEGSTINKIPNILQCTLPPRPVYQTLFFNFSRVWFRDYNMHTEQPCISLIPI